MGTERTEAQSDFVTLRGRGVDGLRLHYLAAGPEEQRAEPVVLFHGWPTSSFLWRSVLPHVAEHRRVLAVDLPGFGKSDKPLDATYSFRYFDRALDGFFEAVGAERPSLAVHDLGGPVGLHWLCRNLERVPELALLNTIVYPEASWAVVAFVLAARLPIARDVLTSQWGLRKAIEIGVTDRSCLAFDAIEGTQAPFRSKDARRALAKAGCGLSPKGFHEIAAKLPDYGGPVRIVYGAKDRILPDVAQTMARVAGDLPRAETTVLDDCGHFLQEERPDEVGRLLAEFFAR